MLDLTHARSWTQRLVRPVSKQLNQQLTIGRRVAPTASAARCMTPRRAQHSLTSLAESARCECRLWPRPVSVRCNLSCFEDAAPALPAPLCLDKAHPSVFPVCMLSQMRPSRALHLLLGATESSLLRGQVFNDCTPGGVISPATCQYFDSWLDF